MGSEETVSESYDLMVIGAGPGGVAAAVRGRQLGAKTALVEAAHWGGFCLNRACVPTKLFAAAVERRRGLATAARMGLRDVGGEIDPGALWALKEELVSYFAQGTEGLLKAKGVSLLTGRGRLSGPGRVAVGESLYEANAVILAVGAAWGRPDFPGAGLAGVVHPGRLIEEADIPASALVLGAGPWALEWAQFLAACGCRVTVAARERGLLPGFDPEIGQRLRNAWKNEPIAFLTGCRVVRAEEHPEGGLAVTLSVKDREETRRFERAIHFERRPGLEGLGLESVGLKDLRVNERLATAVPGLWAVGDATGCFPDLSHGATAMGVIAAENALGAHRAYDPRRVPRIAFTSPQAASVGLSEEEAEEAGGEVITGTAAIAAGPMAMIQGAAHGVVKVVGDKRYGELLGVHVLSPFATEIIGAGVLALQMEATLEELADAALPHPTIAESLAEAAREALGRTLFLP